MFREEHPNPQFLRSDWINMNGEWDFEFDFGCSGKDRKLFEKDGLEKKINVPFCPESELSGIGYKDFMNGVWYMRSFEIPSDWAKSGKVFINFGAVDYRCTVYVNKQEAGQHKGGYSSFKIDITKLINVGSNTVCVYAEDNVKSLMQPSGKQATTHQSTGCFYTRTTGIWQTVYLEHTPDTYIERFEFYPNPENSKLNFKVITNGYGELTVKTAFEGKATGATSLVGAGVIFGEINLSETHLWEVGNGRLYDVELMFGGDKVTSYFGLRSARMDGMKFLLNGKSVFQRLVLDQGFYADGIYTAPNDKALEADILLSIDAGFNGARLHEKVFEPRFLYYCDKHGYLVWGEYPNWGIDLSNAENLANVLGEWRDVLTRDFNHPSIIGWCPYNETFGCQGREQWNPNISEVYYITKLIDQTRPCIDTSGFFHTVTDIFDLHDYEQNPETFARSYDGSFSGGSWERDKYRQNYTGGPYFISEYGGIRWAVGEDGGWGYGNAPKTVEEFIERYRGLTNVLLDNPDMFGFCYTQLYDVEQEVNGLYTYGRKPKFDMSVIRAINTKKAAIENL